MKKSAIFTLLLSFLVATFSSCQKDETKVYLSDKATSPKLTSPAVDLSFVLKQADQDKSFTTFTWDAANYGFKASIQYLVQFSKNADMSKAKVLSSVNLDTKYTPTILAVDQFLVGKLNLTPNVPTKVYYRVVASVIGLPADIYPDGGVTSNIQSMTVTAFDTPLDIKTWGVVGSATPNGWNGPDYKMDEGSKAGTYEATVYLTAGEIKFRYNNDWGINLGGSPGSLTSGGPNITIGEAGNYEIVLTVSADKKSGSYTIKKL